MTEPSLASARPRSSYNITQVPSSAWIFFFFFLNSRPLARGNSNHPNVSICCVSRVVACRRGEAWPCMWKRRLGERGGGRTVGKDEATVVVKTMLNKKKRQFHFSLITELHVHQQNTVQSRLGPVWDWRQHQRVTHKCVSQYTQLPVCGFYLN